MSKQKKPKRPASLPPSTALPSQAQWREMIQKRFQNYRQVLRRHQAGVLSPSLLDLTAAMGKRREKAVLNQMETALGRISLPSQEPKQIGEEWIELNLAMQTYSRLENDYHILFAAAIWILDQLLLQDNWREVLRLLPQDSELIDELCVEDIRDPRYDYDLILSVEYVLRNRNPEETEGSGLPRVLTSDLLAKGKRGKGPDRENFERLMAMIPPEAIQRAVERFRETFWQWTQRYYEAVLPLMEALQEGEQALKEAEAAFCRIHDEITSAAEQDIQRLRRQKAPFVQPTKPDPLRLRPPQPGRAGELLGGISDTGGDPNMRRILSLREREAQAYHGVEQADQRVSKLHSELRSYSTALVLKAPSLTENLSTPAPELLPMAFENPYELCFALLWLIEADDDLPWLYGPGCGLMVEVGDALPWGVWSYEETEDPVWSGFQPIGQERWMELPEVYRRSYPGWGEDTAPLSLAQIVYRETGCLLPRDLHLYDPSAKALVDMGMDRRDAAHLGLLMSVLAARDHQVPALQFRYDLDLLLGLETPAQPEEEAPAEDAVDIDALRSEIKGLRSALHHAEQEGRKVRRALEDTRAQMEREHRELADLREYLFRQEEEAEDSETEETLSGPDWPYEVGRDTVIFGGHATWSKGIRGILTGNVRFVRKDMLFDTKLVKRAEVVWIQPNAISHPMYWRVLDTARACKKPVRYFGFASWAKCAQQVREGDRG